MANSARENKIALMLLTVPVWEHRPMADGSLESVQLFYKREAIKRKAAELDADIVAEFEIPKPAYLVNDPLFQEMLHVITEQQIDYVLIYPIRLHRMREESERMAAAINAAGARIFSAMGFEEIPEALQGILSMATATDRFKRIDAQRKAAWRRARRAKDAA